MQIKAPQSRTRSARGLAAGAVVSVGVLAAGVLGLGQQPPADQAGGQPSLEQMGDMLVGGLKGTEGCVGVDVAQFESGKTAIVGWFENKAAAVRWYESPMHQRLVGSMGDVPVKGEPLEHVADDVPVMVIASISFNGPPAVPGAMIPFNQISIELYTPLPGGASINGRLTPETVEIPHHRLLGD